MQNHRALPTATMIQEYRIERVLGSGNFGVVYQASNIYLEEVVAIKEFLPVELAHRRDDARVVPLSSATEESYRWALDHFLKEAKILWELGQPAPNPNIIQVKRFHKENGTAYMVMEYEEGNPLSKLLAESGTLTQIQIESILFPLLDGLESVHKASVLHRDIKPSNIVIRSNGSPVLIDFGAARTNFQNPAHSTMAVYSPTYAAPEQITPVWDQGPWTDIYSLAATLYRAVIGSAPIPPLARSQMESYVPAIEALSKGYYSPIFLKAIDTALELNPSKRPQDIAEFRNLLLGIPIPIEHSKREHSSMAFDDKTVVIPQASKATWPENIPTQLKTDRKSHWKNAKFTFAILVLVLAGISTFYYFRHLIPAEIISNSEIDPVAVNNQVQEITRNTACSFLTSNLTDDFKLIVSGHVPDDMTRNSLKNELRAIHGIERVSLNLNIYERPFCEIIGLLQKNKRTGHSKTRNIGLEFNRANRIYQTGDYLVVKVKSGQAFPGYLYVDYFDGADNVVTHLLPSPPRPDNAVSAGDSVTLGIEKESDRFGSDRSYLIQRPGKNLIVVLFSRKPLFKEIRPEEEPISNYLDTLQNALAKTPEQHRSESTFEFITVSDDR